MTGKLIKYEMKAFGRIMWPLYGIFIILSIISGVEVKLASAGRSNLSVTFTLAMVLFSMAIIAVLAVLLVVRFYRSVNGSDEGYLMFSLPVKTSTLIWSKALSALIWIALTDAAAAIGYLILYLSLQGTNAGDITFNMAMTGPVTVSGLIGEILTAIAVPLALIMRIYAAISIGQTWSGHRIAGSVLAYIGLAAVSGIILTVLMNYVPGWNAGTYASLSGCISALAAVCFTVIFSLITWYFLDRKLNLE